MTSEIDTQEEKLQSAQQIKLLLFLVFLDILGVGLVIPLLPFYAKDLGASPSVLGALGSFYGILQLFGSFFVGKLSDRYGRKVVMYSSTLGACISYFSMTRATSLEALFISRIPVGLCKQTMLIAHTIISDFSSFSDRARYFGYLSTAASLGFIVGPLLGGYLSNQFYRDFPVYISCCLFLVNLVIILIFLDEPEQNRVTVQLTEIPRISFSQKFKELITVNTLNYLLFIKFASTLTEITFSSTFSQFAWMKFSLNTKENGYLTAYQSFLEVLVQGSLVGPFTLYFSEPDIINMSLFTLSIFTIFLGLISQVYPALVILMPIVIAMSMQSTCTTSSITKSTQAGSVGTTLGIVGSLSSFCRAISPFVGGVIINYYGMLGGLSLVSFISFFVWIILKFKPLQLPSHTINGIATI